jgi:hypothetical protein
MNNSRDRVAVRRIPLLETMTESLRREIISHGLTKMVENVQSLLTEVTRTENVAPRASTIVTNMAAEEAGKGFIMVDYMRPYRDLNPQKRSQHLKNVYLHLGRGIYVKYYETRPDTFAEVQSIVDGYRVSHYLDGPNDVDWIFRNEIEEERERQVYVDLVSNEEGLKWYSPTEWWKRYGMVQNLSEFTILKPRICDLLVLMREVGLFSEKALGIMESIWKDVSITSTTRWGDYLKVNQAFLEECSRQGLLASQTRCEELERITDEFLYPLSGLDLRVIQISDEELRQRRERHLRFLSDEYR